MPFSRNALLHTVPYTHLEANNTKGGKFFTQQLLSRGNDEGTSSALCLLSPTFVQLFRRSNWSQASFFFTSQFPHSKTSRAICLVKSFLPKHGVRGSDTEYTYSVNTGFGGPKRSCHVCGNGLNMWWQSRPKGKTNCVPAKSFTDSGHSAHRSGPGGTSWQHASSNTSHCLLYITHALWQLCCIQM